MLPLLQLLAAATAASPFALAQQSGTPWALPAPFEISHLSPEIHYEPAPVPGNTDPSVGWVTNEWGTYTNASSGHFSASFSWWGLETRVYGNLSQVITRVDSDHKQWDNEDMEADDWIDTWPQIQYRNGMEDPRTRPTGLDALAIQGNAFRTIGQYSNDGTVPKQRWNVTFEMRPTSTYNRMINISRIHIGAELPGSSSGPNATGATLVNLGNSSSLPEGVTDRQSAWSASPAPFSTFITRFQSPRLGSPLVDLDDLRETADTVLYTSTPNAPIRFAGPEQVSLFQMYGAVGPDQGEFQVQLFLPEGTELKDFHPHPLTRTFTAYRQQEAMDEVLAVMYLDPRLRYDVEVTSMEEGRNISVQSVAWTRRTESVDQNENWWHSWNDRALDNGGLSGGQIAGIVLGSVAGAAIILGLTFFFWRRSKRNKVRGATGGDGTLSPSQTLTGEAGTNKQPTAV